MILSKCCQRTTIILSKVLSAEDHDNLNPLRAADFSAHLSRATEEFSQNN